MPEHTDPKSPETTYTILPADFTNPSVIALLERHLAFCQDPTVSPLESIKYVMDTKSLQAPDISLWTIWSTASGTTTTTATTATTTTLSSSTPTSPQPTITNQLGKPQLLGCAALKPLSRTTCELKSMHILPLARGTTCASSLLTFLFNQAAQRGWTKMYLETGTGDAFGAARKFYARNGFVECGVYGEYEVQGSSCYMVRDV